jgi:hypothetical protein
MNTHPTNPVDVTYRTTDPFTGKVSEHPGARPEFEPWPKMARLSRECVITEKIDGTNAQVFITEDGQIFAGSRTRWITPADDNYGFARWVEENKSELLKLGPGRHFGEYWGAGIQRRYGLTEKRFSLFNTLRWCSTHRGPVEMLPGQELAPACCHVVPVLYRGEFLTSHIFSCLSDLKNLGSFAAPGFMSPEGIVIYHTAAGVAFKKTILGDESPKSLVLCAHCGQ